MGFNTKTINAFVTLGEFLGQFSNKGVIKYDEIPYNDLFFDGFKHQIKIANTHNGWFTEENILYALESWSNALTINNIKTWLSKYNFNTVIPKKIAIVMAGNIPLVGFHDFLTVLITGHNVVIKQSSNDKHLLPLIVKYLEYIEPEFKNRISLSDEKLKNFDAVIATGSSNTARYFEHYFRKKPSIIRQNRNSVAVLTGNETNEDLKALSEDIFRYYGLGCRNVSKLFVPKDYNFDAFFEAVYHWNTIINENKYANNYDYNKAVYLMSEFKMLDNGFLILKEDTSYSSPIATLFYEHYSTLDSLKMKLQEDGNLIQCVVSDIKIKNKVEFGKTQHPNLWDYADGVDTVDFLLKI